MTLHVVVPTFREQELLDPFLKSWEGVVSCSTRIYVVNGDPGDRTSDELARYLCDGASLRAEEIGGHSGLYWTGLVRLGLERVLGEAEEGDFFVLTNIDVNFAGDPVAAIFDGVDGLTRKQVALPAVDGSGQVRSAGVVVRSWAFSRNRHLLEGAPESELDGAPRELPATYLPTRFLLCPAEALKAGLLPDAESLPHYCADYEYSNRLRLCGFDPVVYTGARVRLREENTGFDTYLRRTSLLSRLRRIRDIKCPYHFGYRYRFVRLVYPGWSQLPGMATHFLKIFAEIALGGGSLQRWRRHGQDARCDEGS